MKIFEPFFVMWTLSAGLWVFAFFLAFGLALMGEYGGILAAVVKIYAIASAVFAILSIPANLAYPPDNLPLFVLIPLLECIIFGIAAYAVGWDRRLHGAWSFQTWYLWGKRLLLMGLIGIGIEFLVAILVISVTQK